MAFSRDLKVLGRLLRKFCMLFKASIAVPEVRKWISVIPSHQICSQIWTLHRLPSTTSMTQRPSRDGTWLATAVCTAMAPPILCPMIMMGGGLSPYRASITLPISLLKKTSDNQFKPGFPECKLFWYIELDIQCVCVCVCGSQTPFSFATTHLSTYLAMVSAERSLGFFTLVSPAGEERKEQFKDGTAKRCCQGTRMRGELLGWGEFQGTSFFVLWP